MANSSFAFQNFLQLIFLNIVLNLQLVEFIDSEPGGVEDWLYMWQKIIKLAGTAQGDMGHNPVMC